MVITTTTTCGACSEHSGRLDPVGLGHGDIHQNDVGLMAQRGGNPARAVGSRATELDVRDGGEEPAHSGHEARVVIDEQDPDQGGPSASGR
jgi:hypothetical protein